MAIQYILGSYILYCEFCNNSLIFVGFVELINHRSYLLFRNIYAFLAYYFEDFSLLYVWVLFSVCFFSCFCAGFLIFCILLICEVKFFARCLLLFARCSLLSVRCSLLFARCLLLSPRYFLLVVRYFLLVAREEILKDFF